MTAQPLLDVDDLTVEFATRRGIVKAVQHVNISVAKGETLGIVGESGSGKSVTSYAVMRILDRAGKIAEGSVMFSGIDVKAATENQMRDLRGREISMIFQNPRAALNPIRKVGDQIEDVLRQHVQSAASDRGEKAIEEPHIGRRDVPGEFDGGARHGVRPEAILSYGYGAKNAARGEIFSLNRRQKDAGEETGLFWRHRSSPQAFPNSAANAQARLRRSRRPPAQDRLTCRSGFVKTPNARRMRRGLHYFRICIHFSGDRTHSLNE